MKMQKKKSWIVYNWNQNVKPCVYGNEKKRVCEVKETNEHNKLKAWRLCNINKASFFSLPSFYLTSFFLPLHHFKDYYFSQQKAS